MAGGRPRQSIDVTIFYPIAGQCGGIRAGLVEMDGALALCYASYLNGIDEVDRMERQQQLLRVIFKKFTHESYLTKLPLLYSSYQGWVKTDISLTELIEYGSTLAPAGRYRSNRLLHDRAGCLTQSGKCRGTARHRSCYPIRKRSARSCCKPLQTLWSRPR